MLVNGVGSLCDAPTVVNSWTEWGRLRHVIVGRVAESAMTVGYEPAVEAKMAGGAKLDPRAGPAPRAAEECLRAARALDGFAALLESYGVRVDRPTPLPSGEQVQTPTCAAPALFTPMPPRDVLLTVGSTLIEAPMSWRCRYWESMCYRPLLEEYWRLDKKMRWYAAPRPQLTDRSYNLAWGAGSDAERLAAIAGPEPAWCLSEEEILFDAADCLRFGRDLFVQSGATTNQQGIEWIARQLPECNVHTLQFSGCAWPTHLDGILAPLRPGLALICPERTLPPAQRALFEDFGWELVPAAPPASRAMPPNCASTPWLSMNVLCLDEHRVFVEASEVHQIAQLRDLGQEVIPVPLRDAYSFGGGLHCCTADVYRESSNESFFEEAESEKETQPLDPLEAAGRNANGLPEARFRYRTVGSPSYRLRDEDFA